MMNEYYAEFQPATTTERSLVDTIAACRWRQSRARTLERAVFALPTDADEILDTLEHRLDIIGTISRYESSLQRQALSAHKCLLDLRECRRRSGAPEPPTPKPAVIPIDSGTRQAA